MKKFIRLGVIAFFIGIAPLSVYADGPFDIAVPSNCTVTDTAGVQHTFPQNDSPGDYLGICALAEAFTEGYVSDVNFVDFGFGLFVDNFNDVAKPENSYWQLRLNSEGSNVGVGDMSLSAGDTMSFILTEFDPITFAETPVNPEQSIHLHITALGETPPTNSGGGGSSGGIPNSQLNVADALAYLASTQHEDGSFGLPMLSDWVAIAFAAADPGDAKVKLHEYLRTATPALSNVTDYERHAMALMALGINPYSGTSVDYITPIIRAFDGTQIGDATLDNDDIFALFPLLSAGYGANDTIIQKTTAFILSRQDRNGSWDGSVDMTAAAIQALVQVRMLPDVSLALIRAEGYLRGEQPNSVAAVGNSFSMSWVRQAISALSWTPSGWMPNLFTKEDRLAELQQSDGGVEPESSGTQTRVWATAYAVPAALGKSWPALLQSFMRPIPVASTSPIVTTNLSVVATSTPSAVVEARIEKLDIAPPPRVVAREKMVAEPVLPVLLDRPTAAVANAPASVFFSHLWSSIAAFFSKFL